MPKPVLSECRRAALALLAPSAAPGDLEWALSWIGCERPDPFAEGLAADQVDQLFLDAAERRGLVARLGEPLVRVLSRRRILAVATVLRQEQVLADASRRLDDDRIDHLVFKGALLRQTLYAEPQLRPSMDVDVLVHPRDFPRAMRVLEQGGFSVPWPSQARFHEICLTKQGVWLDLHRSPMRPGRARKDMTEDLLARRARQVRFWGPSDPDNTLLLLVHPAITDYATGHLVRAVDLDRWIRSRAVDWDTVLRLLSELGLRTAAWSMLCWTRWLFDTPLPREVWERLVPARWRASYLERWLAHNPAGVYAHHRWLARVGFNLALHEGVGDVARAAFFYLGSTWPATLGADRLGRRLWSPPKPMP